MISECGGADRAHDRYATQASRRCSKGHGVTRFFKPRPPYSRREKAGETGSGMVVLLQQSLAESETEARPAIGAAARQAAPAAGGAGGARASSSTGMIADGTIRWDGATDILPLHLDSGQAPQAFSTALTRNARRDAGGGAGSTCARLRRFRARSRNRLARWARSASPWPARACPAPTAAPSG